MFAKRLIQKATQQHHHHHHHHHPQHDVNTCMAAEDLSLRNSVHYGIPSTSSLLAFDPIQRLLAIGTLDGRIKVIGGDNIEGLLISEKQLPYKYLEFLTNQGFLVSISNDNDIQVWNLEGRCIACSLQWDSNITAFSVIWGSNFMYVGDEYGLTSVLEYQAEEGKLLQLPYYISVNSLTEAAGFSCSNHQTVVGVLPQPSSSGNRVLIAYESGLIILWDVVEARIVVVKGDKALQLKDGVIDSPSEVDPSLADDTLEQNSEEREISALCWASSKGSVLAVGYVDGDLIFWKTSTPAPSKGKQAGLSSNSVVKLQLSSAERRIPVIVLHWRASNKSRNDVDGQLFVYGGDEIGSEEVLTVLTLEWSSDMETLRCVGRVDLTLTGSFADMILLPNSWETGGAQNASLFVLTSPGQLHYYDSDSLSSLVSQQEKKTSVCGVEFPAVIPTVDPLLTAVLLASLPPGGSSSIALLEIASLMKQQSTITLSGNAKWPLTGGVSNQLSFSEDKRVERVYIAGYQDGSVRMWDATYPVLTLICVLEGEVTGIKVAGSSASVSKIDFCFPSLSLAIGNECGLVRFYNLNVSSDEKSFHFISETKHEVHNLPQGGGPNCRAVFSLLNSPVRTLQFVNHGAKLAVGYECGRVMVFDMSSLSVLFTNDSLSGPSSPIVSMTWKAFMNTSVKSPKQAGSKLSDKPPEDLIFIVTGDAKVYAIDGCNGKMISSRPMNLKKESTVISMYVLEGNKTVFGIPYKRPPDQSSDDGSNEPSRDIITQSGIEQHDGENHSSYEKTHDGEILKDSLLLLCCKDKLCLYPTKSVVQGEEKSISKVKLANPCCWTSTLKKDEKVCGLVLLYQTGAFEIRSLPDLELLKESSLTSILRWNFKANMDKRMSSTDNGQIALATGSELAFISLLASENDFRIPESLPSLHDKVLAAAAEAAINFSSKQKKKQDNGPGILGGIVKGFKGGKVNHTVDFTAPYKSNFSHLESAFSKDPFPDPSPSLTDDLEAMELDIDEIEIDEPVSVVPSSYHKPENNQRVEKVTEREREKLLGADADAMPKLRTREEIIAKYRKAEDASSVAGQARDKLLERQQKLERISKRTEELQSGAEDFKSMADELVKVMESRKWWQI